jgi:NADPH:quinone reductase
VTRAIVVRRLGGPEVLVLEDYDPGRPTPGEVRVRVAAAGVNFRDTHFRAGRDPVSLPYHPGVEGAGTVESVGAGVDGIALGSRVAWAGVTGSYAEVAMVPASRLVPVPDALPLEFAAAALLQGMTAHYLVHAVRQSQPGDVAVVHSAAGGVGLLLVQMLKARRMSVIGVCSTPEKAALAKEYGADHVLMGPTAELPEAVAALTQGRGAHVVYDAVGRDSFEASLGSLRTRGMFVLYGSSSGPVPPVRLERFNERGVFFTRPSLIHYTAAREELLERATAVLAALAGGQLRIHVGRRLPLDQAPEAHRLLEARATMGKVILLPLEEGTT